LPARHPQAAGREQPRQPRSVLDQAAVTHLGVAELLLDCAERVLDLGPVDVACQFTFKSGFSLSKPWQPASASASGQWMRNIVSIGIGGRP
jgi:hypothetical protein